MSCKNKSCCRNTREELLNTNAFAALGPAGEQLLKQLWSLVTTGAAALDDVVDISALPLAREISRLYADRKRLLDLLVALLGGQLEQRVDNLTFRFGPGNRYTLHIPVSGPTAKKELAEALRIAAASLEREPCQSTQLSLPLTADE